MKTFSCAIAILCLATALWAQEPQLDWKSSRPEDQGFSSAKLERFRDALARQKTQSLLVVRNDQLVLEWYAEGRSATDKHYTASLAKAIVGGLSVAVALDDERLTLDDPVVKHVPQWQGDERKTRITVRHLGSHTSGLDDANQDGVPHEKLPGWMGEFWKRLDPPNDPFSISRERTPVLFEPGKRLHYSNPGIAMLTYAVTAAMKDAPVKDVRSLLRERVYRPIGLPDSAWSLGYGQTVAVDGLPLVGAWGGGSFTPRAVARIGELVLYEGRWNGKQVLSPQAIRAVTGDAGLPGHCGIGWWTNGGGQLPGLPRDAVWGAGAGDQVLLVIPSLKLVLVRNGAELAPDAKEGDEFAKHQSNRHKALFLPLMECLLVPPSAESEPSALGKPPYPQSPVIAGIEWAPKESIVRFAKGSDNWPLTWADDGDLYGAYGDGNGFVPFTEKKLSLGLARIAGEPSDIRGTNLRSDSAEQRGEGPNGRKASGLLMVDGMLYMLVRNAANAQLAWSRDHGRTWTWADWKFTQGFGCPMFLNFGRNYAGARDEFVYVYSCDSDSAYVAADRMVLARAPKDRITDRTAYEFFVRIEDGQPAWSKDVAGRGAVFTHAGRCYRGGITYNAGLKRYLWCQVHPESRDSRGPRFQGGFGIYDAPEPWGPWTTVDFTNEWDVGPGETSSFPTKWMSADGLTVHLVFSGDDAFSVRKATLKRVRADIERMGGTP